MFGLCAHSLYSAHKALTDQRAVAYRAEFFREYPVHTASDVTQLIGNTPLLHLKQVSEQTGCTILGKAEFLNPAAR